MPLIVDNNKLIKTDIITIVNKLQDDLRSKHIDKLNSLDIKQNNIRITCPIHKDGHERTPSCEILLTDKNGVPAGTVYCFGCGYRANIIKFIADCLNISYRESIEWLLNFCDYDLVDDWALDLSYLDVSIDDVVVKDKSCVTIDELRQYDYIHPYMYKRKLTDSIIKKFEVGYDPKLNALTFPVYVDGICKFVCKRCIDYKKFIMPKMPEKPIYGLDYVTSNTIVVCESIINALTAISYGYDAIALFGTGTTSQYKTLINKGFHHYILCFDGDEAGRKGAKRFIKNINNAYITDIIMPSGKDLNDLSKEDFDNLYKKYLTSI